MIVPGFVAPPTQRPTPDEMRPRNGVNPAITSNHPGCRRLKGRMSAFVDDEDRELDAVWRARFGQPLPIRGCGPLVRRLLEELPPPEQRPDLAEAA